MVTSVPMFWVGGTPGSGKSTTVRQLARELDLALHPIDAYTYDHLQRLGALGPPLDDVLALGAVAAADDFERTSALRLPTVMDDVRTAQVARVPTLVEGPQLHPRTAATWSPIGAIWLITTAERTRMARRQRLVEGDDAARLRVEALVERDQLIGARLRSAASEAGRAVVEVPTDVDWDDVVAAVREAINTAAAPFARLRPGRELSSRRRHENDAVHRQIVAHEQHIGATLPAFPYACVCGRSGCTDTTPATSVAYSTSV
jgi:dephospho-CoA kinase